MKTTTPSDSLRSDRLPVDLGLWNALHLYLRRLAILISVALANLLLVVLIFALWHWTVPTVIGTGLVVLVSSFVWASRWRFRRSALTFFDSASPRGVLMFKVASILAAIATLVATFNHGIVRTAATAVAISFMIALTAYGLLRSAAELRTIEANSRTLTRVAEPLITALGVAATTDNELYRQDAVEVLLAKVLTTLNLLCGKESDADCATRSVFYQFKDAGRLERRMWRGRNDAEPRLDFAAGRNESDTRVINMARGEEVLLVPDVRDAPPEHFSDYIGRPYRSLIFVPVRAGLRSFGALIVDSNAPRSLTQVDVRYVVLLAGILGVGLAQADRAGGTHEAGIGSRPEPKGIPAEEFTGVLGTAAPTSEQRPNVSIPLIPEDNRNYLTGSLPSDEYLRRVQASEAQRGASVLTLG